MRIPVDKLIKGLKMGAAAKKGAGAPVRIAVYVEDAASPAVVEALRDALVPETTGGIVRVERLDEAAPQPRADTDAVIVIPGGSEGLEDAVQRLVIAGAPVVIVAEFATDAPFISQDTPVLGLVASRNHERLLAHLSQWILDRTDKAAALAANFSFMRPTASRRIIASAAAANALTGALVFMPGANFPVITLAQVEMAMGLAAVHDKPLRPERGYEIATVVLAGLGLRGVARLAGTRIPRARILTSALVAGAGTCGMGLALRALYERDIDYEPINRMIGQALRRVRGFAALGSASGGDAAEDGPTVAEGA